MSVAPQAPSALVIGSDTRAFLGVVRSLGRQGVAVDVVPFDFSSVALASRYIRSVHRLPLVQLDPEAWVQAVLDLCEQLRPDFIVPCDDRSIIPLQEFRSRVAHLRLGMPGDEAFSAFFDKAATRALAQSCGVPVARGRVLAAGDTAPGLVAEFGLPLFVKPRNSYLLRALESRRSVSACHSVEELTAALAPLDRPDEYLVEAGLEGVGVGVSVLAKGGVVSQAFQHRRVREPVGGGGSSYRKSEPVAPDLEAMTVAMCQASRLEGVAMFEYRVDDASGHKALLEVNARFWGSLPLAMAAGVDFPYLWFSQAQGRPPVPRVAYRVPCYARNLLADLYATAGHVESRRAEGTWVMTTESLRWAASLGRLLLGIESLDTLARDDPRPGLREFGAIGQKMSERLTRHLPWTRSRRAAHLRATVAQAWQEARHDQRPVRIVVACYGNICRSPFAALDLARRLADGPVPVEVTGAGLAYRSPRPSPALAVEAAARLGVDLAAHQSGYASDQLLEQADLVLVFDGANLELLASRGVALKHEAIRLAELLPDTGQSMDITDPVDGDAAAFDRCYRRINQALAELELVAKAATAS